MSHKRVVGTQTAFEFSTFFHSVKNINNAHKIMCALGELLRLQIVHLNLKPTNICLQNSGHILLADFYRSAVSTTANHLTRIREH
nr:hypothetical transcript [Hymenolepis microstoma]